LKQLNITAVFTSLTDGGATNMIDSEVGVSSLMDTWLLLRNQENNGENTRTLFILKSRGMRHSNQVREFIMTEQGLDLVDVYLGMGKVLTGTARLIQENADRALNDLRQQELKHKLDQLTLRRKALEAQIAALQAQAEAESAEVELTMMREQMELETRDQNSVKLANMRDGSAKKSDPIRG
nr:KaiC 1 [Bacteroidota bacterium]